MGPAKDCARGPENSPCPPDIVISSSPTFSRRKNFKEAARRRSQEKLRLKKLSMEAETAVNTSVAIAEENTELGLVEAATSSEFVVEEEKTDLVVVEEHSVVEVVVEQSSNHTESVFEEEIEQKMEVVVEQSNHTESVLEEKIEQKMEVVFDQSNHTESVLQENIEQSMEVVVEQSLNHTESVLQEEIEQRTELVGEHSSQVTEFVKEESGKSVMTVVESAGAGSFQPSASRTTDRQIPDSLSLPLEIQAAPTQFWTANSARKILKLFPNISDLKTISDL